MGHLSGTTLGLAILIFALVKLWRIGQREKDLPPGPPTLPLLGNITHFPKGSAHFKLTEWAKTYGGIYSIKMGPATMIVLTDFAAIRELMTKRSGSTVDRPANHVAELVADGKNLVLSRYTETWKTLRRAAHLILTPQKCLDHLPIQKAEATQLMSDILFEPAGFYNHIRRYSSSVVLSVLFGKRAPRYETKEVTSFFHVQHMWEGLLEFGALPPMDLIPILKHIPERFAPWKTQARLVRNLQRELYFGLHDEAEKRMADGHENGCFMEEVLAKREELGMDRELSGYLGGIFIEAGSDTTSMYLQSFILALIVWPEFQKKAQEEMDRVVGSDRAPELADFEHLPFLQACVKETHRFRPVAPLSVPHAFNEEETYNGYRIPKDSVVFVNVYGIYHDPAVFEDPETWNPERFMKNEFGTKDGVDTSDFRHTLPFGSGRRICPGMHLAENSIKLNTMNLVWGFNFTNATDPVTKRPIPVSIDNYGRGILTGPNLFEASIKPRSELHVQVIEREFQEATHVMEPFEREIDPVDKAYMNARRGT